MVLKLEQNFGITCLNQCLSKLCGKCININKESVKVSVSDSDTNSILRYKKYDLCKQPVVQLFEKLMGFNTLDLKILFRKQTASGVNAIYLKTKSLSLFSLSLKRKTFFATVLRRKNEIDLEVRNSQLFPGWPELSSTS